MRPNKLNYEPRGDRVVMRRLAAPPPQPGQVIIPTSQSKPLDEGVVLAVGPGMRHHVTGERIPPDFEVGDVVLFLEYAGFEILVDGEKLLSARDEEIHGRRPRNASDPCMICRLYHGVHDPACLLAESDPVTNTDEFPCISCGGVYAHALPCLHHHSRIVLKR